MIGYSGGISDPSLGLLVLPAAAAALFAWAWLTRSR